MECRSDQFRFFMFNSSTGEPGVIVETMLEYNYMILRERVKRLVYNDNFTSVSTTPDYHFTFTLNAETGEFLAYRDGKENTLFTNDTTEGGQLTGLRTTTDSDLDIGINQAYSPDRFGAFRFYNLYMYDRVLSSSEINTIHDSLLIVDITLINGG